MSRTLFIRIVSTLFCSSLFLAGCSGSGDKGSTNGTPADGVFESADPTGQSDHSRNAGEATDAPTASGGSSAGVTDNSGDAAQDPARAIEEADIIKTENGRLYALSQFGGLSVIDVSTRDKLTLLGRQKVVATPFEMYVHDGIVFAEYQGYGEYTYDDVNKTYQWVQTSEVVIIDARNPASMSVLNTFTVPGSISDSRIVGDILYVASYEDGYCWGCRQNAPQTTVVSLDVSNPSTVKKVAELDFDERTDTYSWHRSIFVNDQRIYVAGPTWGTNGPIGSTIQVIDIADPKGAMVEGAAVQVTGQINSRWQMDEDQGVLRVISQSPAWDTTVLPSVQTFTVVSSSELDPLGQTNINLPVNEVLQSVRFDGTRAYAVTAQQTDPLFTIDLTDPAHPAQVGQITMPGVVYYMEPRGDRLLGLGYDQGNPAGALAVSLFDVSNLAAPKMLSRVNFGGDWSWLSEDQDRIQKAFNVLDDDGLILMPFSGFSQLSDPNECYGKWNSGVQLIDWSNDTLKVRGVAPALSQARRGFIYDQRLFAVSDERVETFDVSNRDAPVAKAALPLTQNVQYTVPAGDRVLRVGQNWWTNTTELDMTPLAQVTSPLIGDKLELDTMSGKSCYGGEYLQSVFADGDRARLVYQTYNYDPNTSVQTQGIRVTTVDMSGAAPKTLGDVSVSDVGDNYYYYYGYGLYNTGNEQVAVGSTLVFANTKVTYNNDGTSPTIDESSLKVIDLSDPTQAKTKSVDLPTGLGATGLVASGSIVARSHFEASPKSAGSVRFYLDRVDVSDPSKPELLPSINVPGSLLAFDAKSSRAVTVDYRSVVKDKITASDCYQNYTNARFATDDPNYIYDQTLGSCISIIYSLKLVEIGDSGAQLLGSYELDAGEQIGQFALGDDRVFVTLNNGYGYGVAEGVAVDCFGICGGGSFTDTKVPVITLAGLQSGDFSAGRVTVKGGDWWSYSPIVAAGKRAALSTGWRGKLSVVDATDAAAPSVLRETETSGYVENLAVVGTTAIASMGQDGVQTIDLGD